MKKHWSQLRTPDTDRVEGLLGSLFDYVSAYRVNNVSVRLRVIDRRFAGLDQSAREQLVWPALGRLDPEWLADLYPNPLLLTRDELLEDARWAARNADWEWPESTLF